MTIAQALRREREMNFVAHRASPVRKSRFNEEQIIAILKEAEAGIAPDELCRRHGITRGSLYRWKAKYGGMEVSEARRLRQLEEENRQLKHAVAELLLDKRALQAVVTKKW
jgi:putative transposase